MTSIVRKFPTEGRCLRYVDLLLTHFISRGCKPSRVKVECPFRPELLDRARYIEAHFVTDSVAYPISRNVNKPEILATTRSYLRRDFQIFNDFWSNLANPNDGSVSTANLIVELCLKDTWEGEDQDWFDLWKDYRYYATGKVISNHELPYILNIEAEELNFFRLTETKTSEAVRTLNEMLDELESEEEGP